MNTFGAMEVSRNADYRLALLSLAVAYLLVYPIWVMYKRRRFQRRISLSVVTSMYKLSVKMSPAEMAYVFSARVGKRHLYATLLDLTNRNVLVMKNNSSGIAVEFGTNTADKLHSYEKLLVGQLHIAGKQAAVRTMVDGFTNYSLSSGEKIRGSRTYVFWWLLRNTLRQNARIYENMTPKYVRLLVSTGVLAGAVIVFIPLMLIRISQSVASGDVDLANWVEHMVNAGVLWLMALMPLLIVSFFLLRFRGLMLGREWLLKPSFLRYIEQIDSYRAFVRLTHNGKLRFESKELQQLSREQTMPYAIALGYVRWGEARGD